LGYTPHPGDLSYPEKLEMMESIAEAISSQEAEQTGGLKNKGPQQIYKQRTYIK
jgi:hypothetical protein